MRNKQSSYKIKKEPIQIRIQAKIKRKVSNKAAVILLPIYPCENRCCYKKELQRGVGVKFNLEEKISIGQ